MPILAQSLSQRSHRKSLADSSLPSKVRLPLVALADTHHRAALAALDLHLAPALEQVDSMGLGSLTAVGGSPAGLKRRLEQNEPDAMEYFPFGYPENGMHACFYQVFQFCGISVIKILDLGMAISAS